MTVIVSEVYLIHVITSNQCPRIARRQVPPLHPCYNHVVTPLTVMVYIRAIFHYSVCKLTNQKFAPDTCIIASRKRLHKAGCYTHFALYTCGRRFLVKWVLFCICGYTEQSLLELETES